MRISNYFIQFRNGQRQVELSSTALRVFELIELHYFNIFIPVTHFDNLFRAQENHNALIFHSN